MSLQKQPDLAVAIVGSFAMYVADDGGIKSTDCPAVKTIVGYMHAADAWL